MEAELTKDDTADPMLHAYDPVGMAHVERLQQRAAALDGTAQAHLERRAMAALTALQARHGRALAQAKRDVERLERFELDRHGRARAAIERGDLASVQRMSRRLPQTSVRLRDEVRKHWEAALDAEVEKRGLSCPGTIDAPSEAALHRAATLDKAIALYRDAMAAAAAELAVARAVRAMPIEAGRYHAGSVATRALQQMQDVPAYLRGQLARVEILGLLKAYGQAAMRAEKKPTQKRATRATRRPRAPRTSKSQKKTGT